MPSREPSLLSSPLVVGLEVDNKHGSAMKGLRFVQQQAIGCWFNGSPLDCFTRYLPWMMGCCGAGREIAHF
eukprot:9088425-Pyramimonas_sp.AAC.3